MSTTRRDFIQAAGAAAVFSTAPTATADAGLADSISEEATTVRMVGDDIGLSPRAYAALLAELCAQADVSSDTYLLGGAVESLERRFADILGKEMAVFMPSGTLANQLALRALAGPRRRVIVPERSHVYNDTGDACQTLANLNLLPLAQGSSTYTLEDVQSVLEQTASGRVATGVGALLIESPVRRMYGECFDWGEAQRILAFARDRGIGTHLDGARLFIASAYTGITPAEYAAPFDSVYVSLWKCFNSGIGAILAGPRALLEDMHHTRRMYGGNLFHGWAPALVSGHYLDAYVERMAAAVAVSEEFFAAISQRHDVDIERIPNGTNVARIHFSGADTSEIRDRLATQGVLVRDPNDRGVMTVSVNESWNRKSAAELLAAFEDALT
ncbi:MAG: beta-eliminating lyase-related protein [Halieaceae bacterium]|jgi:threonine aldolase|nr:beta-eliminating lyase-related protein [Halieaceae bacterium]